MENCGFFELPQVSPVNSSHLCVSWKDVNKGCSDIEEVKIKFNRQEEIVAFNQRNATLRADPCLEHDIFVLFLFEKLTRVSYNLTYNSAEQPYEGILNDSVAEKVCRDQYGSINIPEPPESLKDCGIMSRVILTRQGKTTTTNVTISFKDPANPESSKVIQVRDIQECPSDIPAEYIVAAVAAVVVVLIITILSLLVFCGKKCFAKQAEGKEERNPWYGLYYTLSGKKIEQKDSVIVDQNECYEL